MPTTRTTVLFRRTPDGLPKLDDFEIVKDTLPPLADGQILIENRFLSLDPYMRMQMGGGWTYSGTSLKPGDVMVGRILGAVIETKNPEYKIGDHVVGRLGWRTHAISNGNDLDFKIQQKSGVPLSAYLGACGSNGVTAWVGLKVVGAVKPTDTVLVSAAAGSVGSAVGQIAKDMGCKAYGIAGGAEKCRIVSEEFGFDGCVDYKRNDWPERLRAMCPDGFDVYFDNVGGEMLDNVMAQMKRDGRIPVCGVLSEYNAAGEPYGIRNGRLLFDKSLRLQGFVLNGYRDKWDEARAALVSLVGAGKLKYLETIANGIDLAPAAFIGMLEGKNLGKQLVRLS